MIQWQRTAVCLGAIGLPGNASAVIVPLLRNALFCAAVLACCVFPGAAVLTAVRARTSVPRFVFRKLMHLLALGSVITMLLLSAEWGAPVLVCCCAALALYPILSVVERASWYPDLLVEKEHGEVKKSLSLYFLTVAAVTALAWGAAGQKPIALASLLMWGIGDGAAALVGIPFGKHKLRWGLADGKKSWEGTAAMFAAAFAAGTIPLLLLSDGGWKCLPQAAAAAAVAAFAELVSKNGVDTVTVPLSAAVTLLLLRLL